MTAHLLRAVRWQSLPVSAVLATLLLVWRWDDLSGPGAVMVLRGVAMILALGSVFALDDPAANVLSASPTSLRRRRLAGLLVVAGPVATLWTGALLLAAGAGADVPVRGLTLELAALVAVGAGAAAVLQRAEVNPEPGVLVGPILLGLALVVMRLPERWALLAMPGPAWEAAHIRWASLAAIAVTALIAATRDPAATRPLRRRPA